jgi:pimeloyl-ACP methyl ester carboxylesterase
MNSTVPVVLVHGFWHGSWCWSLVTAELAGRGIASVAVDLQGHGLNAGSPSSRWARPFDAGAYAVEPSPVSAVTATSAAAALVDQVRQIGRGRACVVVAHSAGGVVASLAAEQAPELFREIVYVAAIVPVSGLPAVAYLDLPENEGSMVGPLLAADPSVVGALRFHADDADRRESVRQTFYNDVDEATAAAAASLLGRDAPAGILGEAIAVTAQRYGSVPRSYVTCARDNTVPPALQRRYIEEMDAISTSPAKVTDLDSSHSPFLSQPAALADVIQQVHSAVPAESSAPVGV